MLDESIKLADLKDDNADISVDTPIKMETDQVLDEDEEDVFAH